MVFILADWRSNSLCERSTIKPQNSLVRYDEYILLTLQFHNDRLQTGDQIFVRFALRVTIVELILICLAEEEPISLRGFSFVRSSSKLPLSANSSGYISWISSVKGVRSALE